MLVGREEERERIGGLLAAAVTGHSGVLVVRGEAGMGKTALLDHVVGSASDLLVLRAVGVESESELPFAALHLLLHPFVDRLDQVPAPQANALRGAFGLADVPAVNPFLIGAGTLSLLAGLASKTPILCVVDDAQWLDQGSLDALLFAARRFRADPIAMVFAVREGSVPVAAPGIETLRLARLSPVAAADVLDSEVAGLAQPVRARVLEEAQGNPLALLELGAARLAAQREGHVEPAQQIAPLPVTRRVQDTFRDQILSLPGDAQLMLLSAAADTTADLGLVLRVARAAGADAAGLDAAERSGLIAAADDRLVFRHPLARSAAYQCATHRQRLAVHRAYAAELTEPQDLDRRAWHRAAATVEPDEDVAAELDQAALRAQRRGGAMAVSAAYDRAGRLSVDPGLKAQRIAKAAHAAYDAGRPDRATRLAVEAASLTDDPGVVADTTHLRAQIEYERTSPAADAALALQAAALVDAADPERAVFILTEVIGAGRDACAPDLIDAGARLMDELRLPPDSGLRPAAEAQVGWAELLAGRPEHATAPMHALLQREAERPGDYLHRIVAGFSGLMLAHDDITLDVMEAMLAEVRASGAVWWIPYSLELVALARALRGEFAAARSAADEGAELGTELRMDTEVAVLRAISVWLSAAAGHEDACRAAAAEVMPVVSARHPVGAAFASWGLGLLDLAGGRYPEAYAALHAVCTGPARHDFLIRAVPDLVEAAVRDGAPERVARQFAAFDHWAKHAASPLASALSLRCHALLDGGQGAEQHYRDALELHRGHGGRYELARTQLLLGEWLRRRRRRTDARAELDAALGTFEHLGAVGWAGRAEHELTALGNRSDRSEPRPAGAPLTRLTPQEIQVVRLAATGLSNKQIAERLFLSPRTIGHHLYRAYPKLGIARRMELTQLDL